MAGHFKQLTVWRKSIDFADVVYTETEDFPKHEQYGLCSQMRRAAVSIGSNIAEGQAHHSHKDFIRFLRIARGSIAEGRLKQSSPADVGTCPVSRFGEFGALQMRSTG